MKSRVLLSFLVLLCAAVSRAELVGNTYYVLNQTASVQIMNGGSRSNPKEYTLSGPGQTLTFDVSYGSNLALGNVTVYGYNASGTQTQLWSGGKGNGRSLAISPTITRIKFQAGGTLAKSISNVRVTRATTFAPSPASVSFGEAQLGEAKSQALSIPYNNTTNASPQVTAQTDNAAFTLSQSTWTMGETGTINLTVSFPGASSPGSRSGNVIFTKGGSEIARVPVSVTVVGKYNPEFSFGLTTVKPGHHYDLATFFSSTSTLPHSFATPDAGRAFVREGRLYVLASSGTIPLTISQEGNADWEARTQTYTLSVTNTPDAPHVLTVDNFSLGRGDNKTIPLTGPCDRLTFRGNREWATTGSDTQLQSSTDGGQSWQTHTTVTFDTDTRDYEQALARPGHFRFNRPEGYLNVNFSSVQFHMASYLAPQSPSLDMGKTMEGRSSAPQTLLVDWSDVDNHATLTAWTDNPLFAVAVQNHPCTPAHATWGTGNPRWGQSSLAVTYSPASVGAHSGYVYFQDHRRFTRIPVSGQAYSGNLVLTPTTAPAIPVAGESYPNVALQRALPAGFSTLALPFDTRADHFASGAEAYQLALVTWNAVDDYTLFFAPVADGLLRANEPYLLNLPTAVEQMAWTDVTVLEPQPATLSDARLQGWTMVANYQPGFSMSGLFGIASGQLCQGTVSATLNAYSAYITPPANARSVRTRVAVTDGRGNASVIGHVEEGRFVPAAIYGPDGVKHGAPRRGINLMRMPDGSVRKMWKR